MDSGLEVLRNQIDELNLKLVKILNERASCALKIAEFKKSHGLPVYDPVRERIVLENVIQHNQGPFNDAALRGIFKRIMTAHRKLEEEA